MECHRHPLFRLVVCLGFHAALAAADPAPLAPYNTEPAKTTPLPPEVAAAKATLPEGFHLCVFAAEPDVQQPISMATDPKGRLWIAENYTYSESAVGYHPQLRDRIVVFNDTDNDGHFNTRNVFWDGAQRLTSVEVGLGGVWALALPNLVFIPDANGDGIADGPPQVILDGFEYQRGRHTVANGLRWGPDGWLYGRHGIQTTSLLGAPGTPDKDRVAMNVGVWRYHPGRRVVEVVAQGTTNPWGMDWDAKGEPYFINTVIGHLWHVIPGAHYRRMYGDDPTPHIYEVIEQHADHVHWAQGEVWTDVRKGVTDVTLAAGGGHAHTGLLIYQGGQWPEYWNGKLLTINYHGRRLNVERLDSQGSDIVGRREPDAFLFADPWFRGIDLVAAPDGSVFVSDWSDTGECHDHDGIHRTSGRIYKVSYGTPARGPLPDLSQANDSELAQLQLSANDWQSRQARRVLADRRALGRDLSSVRRDLTVQAVNHGDEIVRLRSLWALQVSGGVDWALLNRKLAGTAAERSWALRLMEDSRHGGADLGVKFDRWLTEDLPGFARVETHASVRLTLASLLQKLPPDRRIPTARALLQHGEDAGDHNQPWMLWYALVPLSSSLPGYVEAIAEARIPRVQRLAARRFAEEADSQPKALEELLTRASKDVPESARLALLEGLADGFAGRRKVPPPAGWSTLAPALARDASESLRTRLRDLSGLFGDGRALDQIREVALSDAADLPRRRAALQSLIDARAEGLRAVCEKLLGVRELSATAATGLALFEDPSIADRLLQEWPKLYGPERLAVLNALVSRPAWAARLLDAIAANRFKKSDLAVPQARQIRAFNQPGLARQLEDVWGVLQKPTAASRDQTLGGWRGRLTSDALAKANPAAGRAVFANTCGACHKLYGIGGALGPDLTGGGRQNLDYLLDNVLFPNAVVPSEFRQTTLSLKDGRTLTGIVRSRTPQAIVLDQVGNSLSLQRGDIEHEEIAPTSLMPEGLLESLPLPQVLDLFAYLMSQAPPAQ